MCGLFLSQTLLEVSVEMKVKVAIYSIALNEAKHAKWIHLT